MSEREKERERECEKVNEKKNENVVDGLKGKRKKNDKRQRKLKNVDY